MKYDAQGFPESMQELLPERTVGTTPRDSSRIEHFEVSKTDADLHNLRCVINKCFEHVISPGKYAKLIVNGELMMSDTPMEKKTNLDAVKNARGHMLIAGLGMGMLVHALVPRVTTLTIVEKDQNVIDLVGPSIDWWGNDGKMTNVDLIHDDIFTWKPMRGQRFDFIYFDIWPTICADNLKDIKKLKTRYKRYLAPGGKMLAWMEGDFTKRGSRY